MQWYSSNTETNIAVTYNDTTGKLNFVSTDTDTTYSAGEGISLSGTTFNNDYHTYLGSVTGATSISVVGTTHDVRYPATILSGMTMRVTKYLQRHK